MSSETKWGVAITLILGFLGLGVMAGQGFEVNLWVIAFWSLAAITLAITLLHKEPKPLPPPTWDPPSISEGVVRRLEERIYEEAKREATIKGLKGLPESSTSALHAEWDKAESEAQEKRGKFIAAKVEAALPPRRINPIDLNTMISDWRAKVEQLTQPKSINELSAAKVPLDVILHWVTTPAHLEIIGTSRESNMLKGVECTLVNVERYAVPHDKFVQSQETHPDGKFQTLRLHKHNLYFDQSVSLGFVHNERHRVAVNGNNPLPPCRLTTAAIWRFWFVLTAEDGRTVTKFLCAQWEGEDKPFTPVACPGSVSRAPRPPNPVRTGGGFIKKLK